MPGVIYIQSVPPMFTVKHLREIMSKFGELGRVYLQAEKRGPHKRKRYTEGWVEFKSKQLAKEVAHRLNGQIVGGRRRSAAYDSVWTMKYLHSFKWEHLMEQMAYERRVEQQRLRTEISLEKRKADYFSQQLEKGERLKKLEERVLKKSGLWERYLMQHQQQKVIAENRLERSKKINSETEFLQMIFGGKDSKMKVDEDEIGEKNDGELDSEEVVGEEEEERRRRKKGEKTVVGEEWMEEEGENIAESADDEDNADKQIQKKRMRNIVGKPARRRRRKATGQRRLVRKKERKVKNVGGGRGDDGL